MSQQEAKAWLGAVCALCAAFVNGSVGVISVYLFDSDLSARDVAFLKCVLAAAVATGVVCITGRAQALWCFIHRRWLLCAVCAFFGFFVLYHFETAAYVSVPVAVVAFCFIGSATLVTFVASAVLQRRFLRQREIWSMLLALLGMACLFFGDGEALRDDMPLPWIGLMQACIAGFGYGLFIVLAKRYGIGSGMVVIAALTLFASGLLALPVMAQGGMTLPRDANVWLGLLALALLPTIAGFWFTTKALTLISGQSVQLIELCEPVFALLFGLLFLAQLPAGLQLFGGALILAAILVHELLPSRTRWKNE